MQNPSPFYDVSFGSREPREDRLWSPTKEELTAKFMALTEKQKVTLTWDEALGFIMPNDADELRTFQRRKDSGRFAPWQAVISLRQIETLPQAVEAIPEPNATAVLAAAADMVS